MANQNNIGDKIRKQKKERAARNRFVTLRMWRDTIISMFRSDKGTIPKDIGDDILITNNLMIARDYMTAVVLIESFGVDTPISFIGKINKFVKHRAPAVTVDAKINLERYEPDIKDYGIVSRAKQWEATLQKNTAPANQLSSAAVCLYSLDVVKSGERTYKGRTFIFLRATDNITLKQGIQACLTYLAMSSATGKRLKTNLPTILTYALESCNEKPKEYKDIPFTIYSATTLAETLPITQGASSERGVLFGINMRNRYMYYVNFKTSARAKNIYVVAISGEGKTFLVETWLLSFFVQMFNICVMDLKGNEFTTFVKACNGKVLSMRADETMYVNTFPLSVSKVQSKIPGKPTSEECEAYYRSQLGLSKHFLNLIVDSSEQDRVLVESFVEEFLTAIYLQLGVSGNNPHTWYRADGLNPYRIYEYFIRYISPDVESTYASVIMRIKMQFSSYIREGGQMSGLFRSEYRISDIIDSKVISFDYGMLNDTRVDNPIAFHLKIFYMSLINDEFSRYKKSKGEWTVKVLEESQVADDYLLKVYREEMTLRRAQNQITILLGNSVTSLKDNPAARALFDSINILTIGVVNDTSRKILVEEFGLEEHEKDLERIYNKGEYEHCFLFVNRALKSTTALLKAEIPEEVVEGKLFKIVDTE